MTADYNQRKVTVRVGSRVAERLKLQRESYWIGFDGKHPDRCKFWY